MKPDTTPRKVSINLQPDTWEKVNAMLGAYPDMNISDLLRELIRDGIRYRSPDAKEAGESIVLHLSPVLRAAVTEAASLYELDAAGIVKLMVRENMPIYIRKGRSMTADLEKLKDENSKP